MVNVMYQLSAVLRQQQVMVLQGGALAPAIVRRHKAEGLGPPTKVERQTSHVPRGRVLVPNQEKKSMRRMGRSTCENTTCRSLFPDGHREFCTHRF